MLNPIKSPAGKRQGFFFGISVAEGITSFLIFFFLALFYFQPLLNPQLTLVGPDLALFFIPFRQMWVDMMLQGHFPLWEPFTSSGNPLFATLQGAVLYPLSFLFWFLDFFQAFNLNIILHYSLAGFFMYWLLRATDCSRTGSAFGALVFMFGGYLFSLRFYLSTLFPVVWSPLLILCFFGGWMRKDPRLAIASAIIAAFMLFAGGVETCYQIFAWLILFSLFPKILFPESCLPTLKNRLIYLGLFLAVFIGLSAIQLFPTQELVEHSLRSGKFRIEYASQWSLSTRDWLSLILLDPYGYIAFPRSPEDGQAWMQSQYMGVIPLTLAAVYLFKGGVRAWTLLLVITISCALALGAGSPLYELFFEYLPWFGSFRYPVKFILPLVLVLAIASAWGWDRFNKLPPSTRMKGGLLGISTLCMMGFGMIDFFFTDLTQWMSGAGFFRPNFNNPEINLGNIERLLGFAALFFLFLFFHLKYAGGKKFWAGAALFVFFLDIFFSNQGNYEVIKNQHYIKSPPVTRFLMADQSLFRVYVEHQSENIPEGDPKKRLFGGVKMYSTRFPVEFRNQNRVQQLGGWNVIGKKQSVTFRKVFYLLPNKERLHILRMANVKYIVHAGAEPLADLPLAFIESPAYREALEKNVEFPPPLLSVYENPGYLGRAFLSGNCMAIPDGPVLNSVLLIKKWDPEQFVFLPESPPDLPCVAVNDRDSSSFMVPDASFEKGEGAVRITQGKSAEGENNLAPGEYRLQVDSARKQFLVLSDSFYPGWEASVDGQQVTIHRANQAFRAIVMPAGKHEVEFRYRPKSFLYGAWISGVTLIAGIIFVSVSTRRRREAEGRKIRE